MSEESSSSILGELDSLVKDPKCTDNLSAQTDDLLAKAEALAKSGRLQEAVDELLVLEKKARQCCDANSCSRLTCTILRFYKDADDYVLLNEQLSVLCRKRGQLKMCIINMVRLCMEWVEATPDKDIKWNLIQTLINVTEGKIFVEVERARLTLICSRIKEAEGNVDEAASLLQEVQVETFGAMEKREKAEYVLEQIRLVLLRKDYVRCQIISRKLNSRLLDADDFEDIKLRYCRYMVEYHLYENQLLEVCKAYYAMLNTATVLKDEELWQPTLKSYVIFLLISPFDNEQRDLLLKLQHAEKKKLHAIPTYKLLVESFLSNQLINWPLSYADELRAFEAFQDKPFMGGEERWALLRKRALQHDIQVVGGYYSRISTTRLASLLAVSKEECEMEISELVSSKYLKAKMDRPAGSVSFGIRNDTCHYLNRWSGDIAKLLDLVEESSHLIQKERMIHAARLKQAQMQLKNMPLLP